MGLTNPQHLERFSFMVASISLQWLDPNAAETRFPPVEHALTEPNGLLAFGGNLSPGRLLNAYRRGIFPWYSEDQPILWWSPDPRSVLYPEHLRISHSLGKTLRKNLYTVTTDQAFREVIRRCAEPRGDGLGTWLGDDMIAAYCRLHELGHAHSAESWHQGKLVGGLYGLAMGRIFFGESMFSRSRDASKVAFVQLVTQLREWGYVLIDCQVASTHMASLGAVSIPRRRFIDILDRNCDLPDHWGTGKTGPGFHE
jgi:leucyl/phenylalanyl-tRNA--protein transferase